MLRIDYGVEYGEIRYTQTSDKRKIVIKIHWANALCAFIYFYNENGKEWAQLVSFFADAQHMRNCEKSWDGDTLKFITDCGKISSIKLNMYYKNSNLLLKHFTRAGYKVTCYYKEPKK